MNSNEMAKTTHYFPNGEGRDLYIYSTNGGICKNTYPYKFNEEGRVTRRIYSPNFPSLGSKSLKYKSNGTGRDTYIGHNHGGLSSAYQKYSFYSSLRKKDYSGNNKMYATQTIWQNIKRQKDAYYQQQTILRLSSPKNFKKLN